MSWLRSLLASQATIATLERERDTALADNTELRKTLKASEARLLDEINSNREREDAQTDRILAAFGARPLPRREQLNVAEAENTDSPHIDEIPDVDPDLEADVEARARAFADDAANRGIEYDSLTYELLKDKIRSNPSEYLEN
jgi:hypothetical protein